MNFPLSEAEQLEFQLKTLEFNIKQLQLKSDETVIVKTHSGRVKGSKRRTIYNEDYFSFERIPYALPPIGELRFRAPKPMHSWHERVLDCTHYGDKPMQLSIITKKIEGSEDCLFLNVYTNNVDPKTPRPVMVYIYGGGFKFGEANREWYGPDYFMKKDVVLITVQYRLGALGFISFNDPHLHTPGNAGIKDQILALKWIQRNCGYFGGNPDNITLFGESAGGMSVHILMLTEQAKGLFHRAICQSGVATFKSFPMHTTSFVLPLAEAAGYKGDKTDRSILKFLLNCTAQQIVEAETHIGIMKDEKTNNFMSFAFCVEPYFTQYSVMCRDPMDLMENAWGNNIPLITGVTSNEGLFFLSMLKNFPEIVHSQVEDCMSFVPSDAAPIYGSPEHKAKGLQLRKIHIKDEKPTDEEIYELISYSYFLNPMQRALMARLQYAKRVPTYLYRFDFDSDKLIYPYRIVRCGRNGVPGVAHADELAYMFTSMFAEPQDTRSPEYHTIERMIGLWTTFAETGNPNGKIHGMKGIKWHSLRKTDETWKCLNISSELKFIDLPEMQKLKQWRELYDSQQPPSAEQVDVSVFAISSL